MVMSKWQSTGFKATDEINRAYAEIVLTTDPLLNFTDHYAAVDVEDELETFDDMSAKSPDRSLTGSTFTSRFRRFPSAN